MDIVVMGRNMDLSQDLQDDVQRKVEKLGRYMTNIGEIRVDLAETNASNVNERHVAQITVRNERGKVLRAEERSGDVLAALDEAVDKMSRQIERYKGRGKWRRRGKGEDLSAEAQMEAMEAAFADELSTGSELGVVRRKRFEMIPMNDEEAIEQLELLDHDFFVFYNVDTAVVNVVYRRKGGGYGILEPELA